MGSGEGVQGPVGGLEVGQGRAGGGTTYNWGIDRQVGQVEWGAGNQIACAWEELRHLPTPSLFQWRKSPERLGRQDLYSRVSAELRSQGPSCPPCTSREELVVQDGVGGLQCSPPGPHCCALGLDVVSLAGLGAPGRGQAWVLGQPEGASLCWQARCPAGHAGSRGTSHPAHQRLPSAVPAKRPRGGRTAPAGTPLCCRIAPGPAAPGG